MGIVMMDNYRNLFLQIFVQILISLGVFCSSCHNKLLHYKMVNLNCQYGKIDLLLMTAHISAYQLNR